jgi:FAD/FMN-containing dehydrogenase
MTTVDNRIDGALVRELQTAFRGELLRPGDNDYELARVVWNAMISRMPALIARCSGAADVQRAVEFARSNNLLASIRGAGHSVAGHAVCDGGLMIDLSRMKAIRVDPAGRTVRADPGLTWGEFDRETQAFGLATTGGAVSTTGIAGLTLGGGLGYLMRRFGLVCDNLISIDIVTADGELRTASKEENSDLFWGIRGGGGNFGIVTSFEYQLHELGPTVLAGLIVHPLSAAKAAMQFYREFTATAPDELTTHFAFATLPDGTQAVGFALCYSGPLEQGDAVIQPLRKFGTPIEDSVGPMRYIELQAEDDPLYPSGRLNYWKSSFIHELSDEAIETMITQFTAVPSPLSAVLLEQLGGAVSRIGKDETAFNEREAPYSLVITGEWTDPAASAANIRWTREVWGAMQPFASEAAYINYLGAEEQDRIRAAYGAAKYDRLVALKNRYDPTNFFCLNQNIRPTG